MDRGPGTRADQVHRALYAYGDPVTCGDLALVMEGFDKQSVYKGLQRLEQRGWVEVVSQRPRLNGNHGGKPEYVWGLTESGRDNVPDPVPHSEVGHTDSAPSIRPGDLTDYRNQPHVAPVIGETRRHEGWPVLTALRSRDVTRHKLREAAVALPMDDPLRKELLARVETLGQLSPVETEYLRYAALKEGAH